MRRSFASVGVLAMAAAAVSCGSKAPTGPSQPTNSNPTISSSSASPAFGIAGLATVTLTASASDPDGDAVTFSWLVNGGTLAGATVSFPLAGNGAQTARLTVTDGRGGTATADVPYTAGTMAGTWRLDNATCGFHNAVFTQTTGVGVGVVVGTTSFPAAFCAAPVGTTGNTDPAAPGSITAAGAVTLRFKVALGVSDYTFTGTMNATGRVVTGVVNGSGFVNSATTLTKQ